MVKFEDIKPKIEKALFEKLKYLPKSDEKENFSLIDGFITLTSRAEISNNTIIGGPNIPVVGLIGNMSGIIYPFALKAILPDIEI